MVPKPPPKSESNGRGLMSIIGDAIHSETIRKELRDFRLFQEYALSPRAVSSIQYTNSGLVLTKKPTDAPASSEKNGSGI